MRLLMLLWFSCVVFCGFNLGQQISDVSVVFVGLTELFEVVSTRFYGVVFGKMFQP